MKEKIVFLMFLLLMGMCHITFASSYYTLKPDFADYTRVPVNLATTLTATVKDEYGNPPQGSIAVSVKPQWTTSASYYTDPYGKITFTIKPLASGTWSITFSSAYFPTVNTYITAVPGVVVDAVYSEMQYIDPVEHKDIIINVTAKETETYSVIPNPSMWEIVNITAPKGVSATYQPPVQLKTGLYQYCIDVYPDSIALGPYTITFRVYYADYYSVPATISVKLNSPTLLVTYIFPTGQTITLTRDQSGTGIEVSLNCPYFDMVFTDIHGRPADADWQIGSKGLEIISSTTTFTYSANEIVVEGLEMGHFRVHFKLVETWYIIKPYIHAFLGPTDVSCETEVKIATIRAGFKPEQWFVSPYFLIPATLVTLAILVKVFKRKKSSGGGVK